MGKIPVGRTIARGYGFLATQFGVVLGLGWLPAVFYAAATWFCIERMGAAMQVATPSSAAFNQFTAVDFLALLVATALLVPTAAIPFMQAALGLKHERVGAHFVFGAREGRLFLALLRFFGVVIAGLVALAFICQIAIGIGLPEPDSGRAGFAMPAEWYGVPLRLWLNGAAALLLLAAYLFLKVRFGFFLAASAAAEEHVTLGRAWTLSRGNFWRLALVSLAIAVPASLALSAAIYVIEGDSLGDVLRTGWTGIPSEGMRALYQLQYDHAVALAGVGAVALAAISALFAGASAAAYQAVREAAEMPEVSRERAEPEFAPVLATADAGSRWRHDPFAASDAVFARHAAATSRRPQPVTEGAVEQTPQDTSQAAEGAEPHAHLAQSSATEPLAPPESAAESVVHEIAWPADQTGQPSPAIQADSQSAAEHVHPDTIAPASTDMAPPLDPAGMAVRDGAAPPPAE